MSTSSSLYLSVLSLCSLSAIFAGCSAAPNDSESSGDTGASGQAVVSAGTPETAVCPQLVRCTAADGQTLVAPGTAYEAAGQVCSGETPFGDEAEDGKAGWVKAADATCLPARACNFGIPAQGDQAGRAIIVRDGQTYAGRTCKGGNFAK
jgi:hypothetical protein